MKKLKRAITLSNIIEPEQETNAPPLISLKLYMINGIGELERTKSKTHGRVSLFPDLFLGDIKS